MGHTEVPEYDDGYDDDDETHVDNVEFGQDVADVVRDKGPCVAEEIDCIHCGCRQIMVHPFDESIPCVDCGKRNASAVPLYPEYHRQDGPL